MAHWYNGPVKNGRVALVGGPYPTLEAAIDAKHADAVFADDHWPAAWTWFLKWVAVELPRDDYVTARRALETRQGPIACVPYASTLTDGDTGRTLPETR